MSQPRRKPKPLHEDLADPRTWAEFVTRHHSPTPAQLRKIARIRKAAAHFLTVVNTEAPACADRGLAQHFARHAMMAANAAVVLDGRI